MAEATHQFMDHYELLGSSPDASASDLKRAYRTKLLEFHPDRRPESAGTVGKQVTQALVDAWQVLQDPIKKKAYDEARQRRHSKEVSAEVAAPSTYQPAAAAAAAKPSQRPHPAAARDAESEPESVLEEGDDEERSDDEEAATPLQRRANSLLREGRALYRAGQAAGRGSSSTSSYRAAIAKFSEAILVVPEDYRLWNHRAICHMALGEWQCVLEDACRARDLCPSDPRNWTLCVRALCEEGGRDLAVRVLRRALRTLPGCAELLAMQAELSLHTSEAKGKADSSKARSRSHSCPKISSARVGNDAGSGGHNGRFAGGIRTVNAAAMPSAWAPSRSSSPSDSSGSGNCHRSSSSVTRGRGGKAPGLLPKLVPSQFFSSPAASTASTSVGGSARSRSPSCASSSASSRRSASNGRCVLPPCALAKNSHLCTCSFLRREQKMVSVLCPFCRLCEAEDSMSSAQKSRPQSR